MQKTNSLRSWFFLLSGFRLKASHFFVHIRCFAENDKYLAAICAAPQVFGAQGVVEGKKATIYPGMESCLKGALPQDEIVVQDGKIITSMGPATAMPFALKLIEVLKGKEASESVANGLLWNRL